MTSCGGPQLLQQKKSRTKQRTRNDEIKNSTKSKTHNKTKNSNGNSQQQNKVASTFRTDNKVTLKTHQKKENS